MSEAALSKRESGREAEEGGWTPHVQEELLIGPEQERSRAELQRVSPQEGEEEPSPRGLQAQR